MTLINRPALIAGRAFLCAVSLSWSIAFSGTNDGKGSAQWHRKMNGIDAVDCIRGIAVHHTNPNIAYALTETQGVFKTVDGGASWNAANAGLPSTALYWQSSYDRLSMHPDDPNQLFVCVSGQIHRTTNGAQSWEPYYDGTLVTQNNGTTVYRTQGVLVDRFPSNPRRQWAGTINSQGGGGVYLRTDAGAFATQGGWTQIWSGGNDAWTLCQDPSAPDTLYFATVHGRASRSLDGGQTWTSMIGNGALPELNAVTAIAVGRTLAGQSMIFVSLHNRFYRGAVQTNGSIAWLDFAGPGGAYDIQTHLTQPEIGWASTDRGLQRTVNGGLNWSFVLASTSVVGPTSVAIQKNNPDVVYVGSLAGGVYRTNDGGQSFANLSNGLPPATPTVNHLALSQSDPDVRYAFVYGRGVYSSTDRGDSWSLAAPDARLGYVKDAVTVGVGDTMWFAAGRFGVLRTYPLQGVSGSWFEEQPLYSIPSLVDVRGPGEHVHVASEAIGHWTTYPLDDHDWHVHVRYDAAPWSGTGYSSSFVQEGISPAAFDHIDAQRGWMAASRASDPADLGVYRTDDGWQSRLQLRTGAFRSVIVHPTDTLRVFAMATNSTVHFSIDGGDNWSTKTAPGGRLRFDQNDDPIWLDGSNIRRLVGNSTGGYNLGFFSVTGLPVTSTGQRFYPASVTYQGVAQHPTYTEEKWVIALGELYRFGTQ